MRINTNVSALNTLRNLHNTEMDVAGSTAKLSSGLRINKASDDAGGLAIANKLRNTGRALQQASRNAQQASSMLQIADGGANTVASVLDRMKELATQAASDNVDSSARSKLDAEYQALNSEITRVVSTSKYQGTQLLAGTGVVSVSAGTVALSDGFASATADGSVSGVASKTYTFSGPISASGNITLTRSGDGLAQTIHAVDGAQALNFSSLGITVQTNSNFTTANGTTASSFNTKTITTGASTNTPLDFVVDATGAPTGNDKISVTLSAISAVGGDILSKANAATAMTNIDTQVDNVNSFLGSLGAAESRIDFATKNIASTIQNTAAAESTIRDVDMAEEMASFSKSNILAQAGTAMLAQANQAGQGVLQLLRG